MSFPIPSLEQLRDSILRDQRNLDEAVDTKEDSDAWIRASADASAIHGLYQYAVWGVNQFFPDTAELESLVRHASARGIVQLPATNAAGSIIFTGTAGAAVPIGTIAQVNGVQYQTTAAGVIAGAGTASIAATAMIVGPGGNQSDNTPGTLFSAPAGIDDEVLLAEMGGGVEAESMESLLARVLERLRQPPAGGNKFDYPRWAREVPGVTAAYCYPKRRGVRTVDVAILSNGEPATAQLRDAVTAYIDDRMPAGLDFMALSPTQIFVDVTGTLVLSPGAVLADVVAKITAALVDYFLTLKPGDTAYRVRILSIISGVAGVVDFIPIAPVANVATVVDADSCEIPALGAVTLGV